MVYENKIKRSIVDIELGLRTTEIKIDGNKINGIRGFYINAGVDKCPSLIIDIIPEKINFKTTGEIIVLECALSELSIDQIIEELSKRIKVEIK
jgi:hypothetical protein